MRMAKVEELRKQVEILSQNHEREVDRKDALVQVNQHHASSSCWNLPCALSCPAHPPTTVLLMMKYDVHQKLLVPALITCRWCDQAAIAANRSSHNT